MNSYVPAIIFLISKVSFVGYLILASLEVNLVLSKNLRIVHQLALEILSLKWIQSHQLHLPSIHIVAEPSSLAVSLRKNIIHEPCIIDSPRAPNVPSNTPECNRDICATLFLLHACFQSVTFSYFQQQ